MSETQTLLQTLSSSPEAQWQSEWRICLGDIFQFECKSILAFTGNYIQCAL